MHRTGTEASNQVHIWQYALVINLHSISVYHAVPRDLLRLSHVAQHTGTFLDYHMLHMLHMLVHFVFPLCFPDIAGSGPRELGACECPESLCCPSSFVFTAADQRPSAVDMYTFYCYNNHFSIKTINSACCLFARLSF